MKIEAEIIQNAMAGAKRFEKQSCEPPIPGIHPLARYVEIGDQPKPPNWIIPGFIAQGVVVISGAPGVGKTTALLPLAMTAAGLHGDDLMPRHWRHVIYVTEDEEQVMRILAGIVGHGGLRISMEDVRERIHIVKAVLLNPEFVATVGTTYREKFTHKVHDVDLLPLVVLDTKSAVLAVRDENDNAEASRLMASLKQGFDGLPVWLVAHIAKTSFTRKDALTSRGAGAYEGDANQTLFLVKEGDTRFLLMGKPRFEPRWPELEIVSHTAQSPALDEFGNVETIVMRWGIARPPQQSRKEAEKRATEQERKDYEVTLRQEIRDAVETAWQTGYPLNRAGVRAKVRHKAADVGNMIENLLTERWLHEVPVPSKDRTNSSKSAFLVNFSTEEHEAVLAGDGMPAHKLVVPASWCKELIPVVPAPNCEIEGGTS
jgi:RecA-family ATPase